MGKEDCRAMTGGAVDDVLGRPPPDELIIIELLVLQLGCYGLLTNEAYLEGKVLVRLERSRWMHVAQSCVE